MDATNSIYAVWHRTVRIALVLLCLVLSDVAASATQPAGQCVVYYRLGPEAKSLAAKAVLAQADIGSVTVMDFQGDYSRGLSAPRQDVAQRFLEGRRDEYDFIVVFTTFEFETGEALALYNGIRNDVAGIGIPVIDSGVAFGSAARLQGMVDMAALGRYTFDPGDPRYAQLLGTLAHEVMHRWAVRPRFRTPGGGDSTDLIGRDGSHWSYFVDSDGSVMYGNDWESRASGDFRSVRVRQVYSPLDLYLGGFIATSEVPPTRLIRGGVGSANDLPLLGAITGGSSETVTIAQIIASEGARVPAAADAPKSFNAGLVLLKRPGEALAPRTLADLERLRVQFQQRFAAMTGGRATIRMGSLPRTTATTGLPEIVIPSALSGVEAQTATALAWLRAQQRPDGRFEDEAGTAIRDTAYALLALRQLAPNDPAVARAQDFLRAASPMTLEEHAWRAVGLPTDRAIDLGAIAQLQPVAGRYALARGLESTPIDSQVAVEVLGREDPRPTSWQQYVSGFDDWAAADGSIGAHARGAGLVGPTTLAIANLALVDPAGSRSLAVRNAARTWLLGRQSVGGAFGSRSDSLQESLEVFVRQAAVALPPTPYGRLRNWVRSRQGTAGDFAGSVYATSLALLGLTRDGAPNYTVVDPPAVQPGAPVDGTIARLSALIENSGGAAAPATTARFYDGDPDAGGTPIGAALAVAPLNAGARASVNALWDTLGRAGSRQIFVAVDPNLLVIESNEADNRAITAVQVASAPAGPELALFDSEVSIVPSIITTAPVEVVVRGVLRNLGTSGADQVLLRLSDAAVAGASTLAETTVGVAARGQSPFELRFTVVSPQSQRLRIAADPEGAIVESDENNNAIERSLASGGGIDLALAESDIEVVGGSPVLLGSAVTIRVRVRNLGASDSPVVALDATIVQAGQPTPLPRQTTQVGAGSSATREFSWVPASLGAARIEVVVDPLSAAAEINETNNTAARDVVVESASGANLLITDARIELFPAPPREGQPLRVDFAVRNVGADPAPGSTAALYAGDPRVAGVELARIPVAALGVGEQRAASLQLDRLGLRGDTTFYVMVDADRTIAESNENDNFALKTTAVLGLAELVTNLADVQIEPSQPVLGEAATLRATIRNIGQQAAGGFAVRLSEVGQSTVAIVPDRSVPGLPPGASTEVDWTWTFGQAPGVSGVRVVVDPGAAVPEANEDNNQVDVPLSLQDGGMYASNRYLSPNGDGVRDTVRVAYRLPVAEAVRIEIRNAADTLMRSYSGGAAFGGTRGEVTWDGRNARGRVVPDGDYRALARGADGRLIGERLLTVDTNKTSAVHAVGTPRSRLVTLPPTTGSSGSDWAFGPRGAVNRFAVYAVGARPADPAFLQRFQGIYRSDTLFPSLQPVLSTDWLSRFVATRALRSARVQEYRFLPDGRTMVFTILLETPAGARSFVYGTARADTVDAPTIIGAPQAIGPFELPPRIVGLLDNLTMLVTSYPNGIAGWRAIDLRTGVATNFAENVPPEAEAIRVLPTGVLFAATTPDGRSWQYVPRSGAATVSLGTWNAAAASPDGSALAVLFQEGARQSIDLIQTSNGTRRPLVSIVRAPFGFGGADEQLPEQLAMAWIARAGELLVIDAQSRRVLNFAADGEALGAVSLPAGFSGPLNILEPDDIVIGSAIGTYLNLNQSAPGDLPCSGTEEWVADSPTRQWFDAANDVATISLARMLAVRRNVGGETPGLLPVVDFEAIEGFDVDLLGELARTTEQIGGTPAWMFNDGSRIGCNGSLVSATGQVLDPRWEPALSLRAASPDESQLLFWPVLGTPDEATGGKVLGSFLNLPAVLRAEALGRAIRLYGLATDRHFARWELDWTTPSDPTGWQSLTAPSEEEIVLDDFLSWTPPEPGSYLVRLRAFDLAGNVDSATVQVVSQFSADLIRVSAAPRAISPNGDGVQDATVVNYEVRRPTTVRIEVRDANGMTVRSVTRVVGAADIGPAQWTWDGRSDAGAVVPEGRHVLWINDNRFSLLVDVTPPTGSPRLHSPYVASRGRAARFDAFGSGPSAIQDPFLVRVALQADAGAGWIDVAESVRGDPAIIHVPVESYGGRSYRAVAFDLAGNRAIFPLGAAALEISIAGRAQIRLPQNPGGRVISEPAPINPHLAPFVSVPEAGVRYILPVAPDADLLEISTSIGDLVEVELETAPLASNPAWTVRARSSMSATAGAACAAIGVPASECPLAASPRHWQYLEPQPDPVEFADGRTFLTRVVGRRADGSRVGSNWVRFEPDSLEGRLICANRADDPRAAPLRNSLLQQAGIDPRAVPANYYIADLDLPLGDALLGRPELSVANQVAGILLATVDGGALIEVLPSVLAAIPPGGSVTGILRFDSRLNGRRSLAMRLTPCAPNQPSSTILATVGAFGGPECTAQPSGKIALGIGVAPMGSPALVRQVVARIRDPATGEISPALQQAFSPAVELARDNQLVFEISTTELAPGPAELLVEIDSGSGLRVLAPLPFPVDRSLPEVAISSPQAGDRICAVRSAPGLPLSVAVTGAANAGDAGAVTWRTEAGEGGSPVAWLSSPGCTLEGPRFPAATCYRSGGNGLLGEAPVEERPSRSVPQRLLVNGAATVRLRASDWSGAQVCTTTPVIVDSKVEIDDPDAPRPLLGAGGAVPVLGLSGVGTFARLQVPYQLGERIDFRLDLYALQDPQNLYSPIVQTPLSTVQEGFAEGPQWVLQWDGRIGGSPVAEGNYGLVVTVEDGCGFTESFQYRLVVDRTPPAITVTSPANNQSVGGLLIEVLGTVTDARLQGWQVLAGGAAPGDALAPIGEGNSAVPAAALLGQWVRGGLTGPARIVLLASDQLENSARIDVPVVLGPVSQLVVAGGVAPLAFSPNGDTVLDTARLAVTTGRAVVATLRVLDESGQAIRTLASGQAVPSGAVAWTWDGLRDGAAAAANGIYRFELRAVDAANASTVEVQRFAVALDTQPPVLTPLTGTALDVPEQRQIGVLIDEALPARFDADLVVVADGRLVARRGGSESGDIVLAGSDSLDEVEHRLVVRAADTAGNVAQLDHRFHVDRTSPFAAIAEPIEGAVLRRGATVRIVGAAMDARLARYELSLAPASGPAIPLGQRTVGVEDGALLDWPVQQADGSWRLILNVIDRAGNSARVERPVIIDGTPPVALLTQPQQGAQLRGDLVVEGSATDTNFLRYTLALAPLAGAASGQFSDFFEGNTPISAARLAEVTLSRPQGDYTLRLTVEDRAGLTSTASATFRLDNEPPPIPDGLVATAVANRDVGLDWNDVTASDLDHYRIYRNGAALSASPQASQYRDELAPEGRLRYSVSAVDRAGNESARSAAAEVVLDRTPPVVILIDPEPGSSVAGLPEIVATLRGDNDLAAWRLDVVPGIGGTPQVLAEGANDVDAAPIAVWDTRGLPDLSTHRLQLEARDHAGNMGTATALVTVDNGPPAAPTGLGAVANGADVQLDWSPNGEADLLGYLIYRDGVLLTAAGPPPQDLRPFAVDVVAWLDREVGDGTRRYRIVAIDRAGNQSPPSAEASVTLDLTPPRVTLVEPQDGLRFDDQVRLRAQSADTDIDELTFAWRPTGNGAWTPIGAALREPPWTVEWSPGALPLGSYQLRALARDQGGREDPTPPVVTVEYADITPPEPPQSVRVRADGLRLRSTWMASTSTDVAAYRIYRSVVSAANLLAEVPATTLQFEDIAQHEGDRVRSVLAVDTSGNVSTLPPIDGATIFNVTLDQPYTPVSVAASPVSGMSPQPGTIETIVETGGVSLPVAPDVTDSSGRFVLGNVPLAPGSNRVVVRVTDARGNRSIAADTWIDRATIPAAPMGVNAAAVDRLVTISWSANSEAGLLGYRVLRNGNPLRADEQIPLLNASATGLPFPSRAVDNDAETSVPIDPQFDGQLAFGPTIELYTPVAANLLGLRVLSANPSRLIIAGDVDAWSGRAWVRVASFDGNSEVDRFVAFATTYRTQRVRLSIRRVPPLLGGAIAELDLIRRPVVAATSDQQTVTDGQHRYRVIAVEQYAFEGPASPEAVVEVGDAQPPEPVVLTGTVERSDAVLGWTASASADAANYVVRRDGRDVARVSAAAPRIWRDVDRPNGSYDYTVVAEDAFENTSVASNTVRLTVVADAPGAPLWVSVQAAPEGRALLLGWQAGTGPPPARFVVQRADVAAGPFSDIATTAQPSWRDAPLIDGRTYHYRLVAQDMAGNPGPVSLVRGGIPRDSVAPAVPTINFPTSPSISLLIANPSSDVCGRTEPGARVAITNDRGGAASVEARSGWSIVARPTTLVVGTSTALSRSGRYLFLSGYGRGSELHDLDAPSATQRWPTVVEFADFTADGAAIIAKDFETPLVYRIDRTNGARTVIRDDFESVSAISVSPDGRRALIAGRLAATPSIEGPWLWDLVTQALTPIAAGGATFASQDHFKWSPDGSRLALVQSGPAATALLVQPDGSTIEVTLGETTALPQWMPDGQRMLVAGQFQTGARVREIDLSSGTSIDRLDFPVPVLGLAVDPSGRHVALASAVRVDIVALDSGQIVATDNSADLLRWSAGHRLLIAQNAQFRHIDSVGSFCARELPLSAGVNRITTTSHDAAGNSSAPSPAIEIVLADQALPDLVIAAADLLVIPSSGRMGEPYTALVTIRNRGTVASPSAAVGVSLRSPLGAQRTLAPRPSGELAPGAARTIEFPLGTLDVAGSWTVRAVVDPANAVVESNEANNGAERTVAVSADGAPLIDLAIEQGLLAPGAILRGDVAVTNPGQPFSGRLQVQIVDASGAAIDTLVDEGNIVLSFSTPLRRTLRWPSGSRAAAAYRIQATLRAGDGTVVASSHAEFAIDAWREVALGISVPAPQYASGALLPARVRVRMVAGNAELRDAQLRLRAVDTSGTVRASSLRALGTLRVGFDAVVPFEPSTAGVPSGPLRIEARLTGVDFLAEAERTVTIVDATAPAVLTGTIQMQPDADIVAGRDAVLLWQVRNAGATALAAVDARLRVVSGDAGTPFVERISSFALLAGAADGGSIDLAALTPTLGVYRAFLEARIPGQAGAAWQALATRSLAVVDATPPDITVVGPPADRPISLPAQAQAVVTDRHSSVDYADLQIDGGAWLPMAGDLDGRMSRTLGVLSDGPHQLRVRAADRHGNSTTTAARGFTIDATRPVITITGVVDGQLGSANVVPGVLVTDANLDPTQTLQLLDGDAFVSGANVTGEGAHALVIRAIDLAGNRSDRTVRFTIDRTAPTVQFISPVNGSSTVSSSVDVVIATEVGASVRLTIGAFSGLATAGSDGRARFNAAPLQPGANLLSAAGTDAAGNTGSSQAVTVQRNDPGIGALQGSVQAASSIGRGSVLPVAVQVANSGGTPVTQQRFRLQVIAGAGATIIESREFVRDLPAGGTYATDYAFDTSAWPLGSLAIVLEAAQSGWLQLDAAMTTVVDADLPTVAVLAPAAGNVIANPVLLGIRATDASSAIDTVTARIDLGPPQTMQRDPTDASRFTLSLSLLAEGARRLDVEARDIAGNAGVVSNHPFVVDDTPPQIVFTGVFDGQVSNAASLSPVAAVVDAHPGSLVLTLDGNPFVSGTAVSSEGEHLLAATAVDLAGNRTDASIRFTLDRTAPVVAVSVPVEDALIPVDRVTVIGNTEPGASVRLSLAGFETVSIADSSGQFQVADVVLSAGANPIVVRATDRAGNIGASLTRTVRYAPGPSLPPTATIATDPVAAEPGTDVVLNWTLSNTTGTQISALPVRILFQAVGASTPVIVQSLSVSLAVGASMPGSATISTAGRPLGSHEAVVEAQVPVAGGAVAWTRLAAAPFQFEDRSPPTVAVLAPVPGSYHRNTVAAEVAASDTLSPLLAVEARLAGLGWVALAPVAGSPGRYDGTVPASADGAAQFEARAIDTAGQSGQSAAIPIVVDGTPPVVTISGVPPPGGPVNTSVLPVITAVDASPLQLVATLDDAPYVVGTPISAEGLRRLRAVATDAAGNVGTAEAQFTIDRTPPVVTIVQPLPGTKTSAASILVAGTTEPRAAVRVAVATSVFDIEANPAGAFSIDGVPLAIGSNLISASARDLAGNQGQAATVNVVRSQPSVAVFEGHIDLVDKQWQGGVPLQVPVTLRNIGTLGSAAVNFRLRVVTVGGALPIATASLFADLAAGITIVRQFSLATTNWPQAELRLILEVDLGLPGQADWRILDDHALALIGSCFRSDLFVDGFESNASGALFESGFEPCGVLSIGSASTIKIRLDATTGSLPAMWAAMPRRPTEPWLPSRNALAPFNPLHGRQRMSPVLGPSAPRRGHGASA